jgi:hypothetical protein
LECREGDRVRSIIEENDRARPITEEDDSLRPIIVECDGVRPIIESVDRVRELQSWLVCSGRGSMSPPLPCVTVAAVDWLHVVLGLVVVQAGVKGVRGHVGRNLIIAGHQGEDSAGEGVLKGCHQRGDLGEQRSRRGRLGTADSWQGQYYCVIVRDQICRMYGHLLHSVRVRSFVETWSCSVHDSRGRITL